MASENVKVAVRVRPFNSRENKQNSKLIISMNNPQTTIRDPSGERDPKTFTFDFSYFSHKGSHELDGTEGKGPEGLTVADDGNPEGYHSQQDVFDDLGMGVLKNAYDGFNTSLFAYGQTGAGKSYSMVGYGANIGIVPMVFAELFSRIAKVKASGDKTIHQVTFSMLEIYMEQVTDLTLKAKKKGGLKVRQNAKLGRFYVEGLSKSPVASYDEINAKMEMGTSNRTVAATQMNATSSRAHTVVTLIYNQIMTDDSGTKTTRSSEINLVDLAGSERAESTGATGDRLKEGAKINMSLSALGNVIAALASGKKAPYRDSVLTKLLQNSLGGNSKTIMIAALSPADINYDETLGTLRYADRAKQIKNKAAVNESATDKLIRELKEENARIKKMLEGGVVVEGSAGMSEEDLAKARKKMESEIRAQLLESNQQLSNNDEGEYQKKLDAMRAEYEAQHKKGNEKELKMKTTPFLINLNEDEALSGMVVHFFDEGDSTIGRKERGAETQPKIILSGISIKPQHCVVANAGNTCTIKVADASAQWLVNGKAVPNGATEIVLKHFDRVQFGTNHLFIFNNPVMPEKNEGTPDAVDWDFAQSELAEAKGFGASDGGSGKAGITDELRNQIMELLPMVAEANAISDRLTKKRTFEIMILSGPAAGLPANEAKVMVKMINLETGNRWMLTRTNFIDRRFLMQHIMRQAEQGDYDDDEEEDEDEDEEDEDGKEKPNPWYHSPNFVILGCATCFLDSLTYNIEFDEKVNIVDYKGRNEGQLHFSVYPCNEKGEHLEEDDVNEEPENLIGQPLRLEMTAHAASGVKKTAKMKVTYEDPVSKEKVDSGEVADEDELVWGHQHMLSVDKVDRELLDWLKMGSLSCFVEVWQSDDDFVPGQMVRSATSMSMRKSTGSIKGNDVINSNLKIICNEFTAGDRDGHNVVRAVRALLDGKGMLPASVDKIVDPTADVGTLQRKLADAEEQIRSLRRKSTLAQIVGAKARKQSVASNETAQAQLKALQEIVEDQQDSGAPKVPAAAKKPAQKSSGCTIM